MVNYIEIQSSCHCDNSYFHYKSHTSDQTKEIGKSIFQRNILDSCFLLGQNEIICLSDS